MFSHREHWPGVTGQLVGTICLYDFSNDNAKCEIGFELLPRFQGKGLMQEAASKVIASGFQHFGLDVIDAYSHAENHHSTRLLEKLHFKRLGVGEENLLQFQLTQLAFTQ